MTSPLNITSAATELSYPSRTVFDLRLRRLTSTLAAIWCSRREDDRLVPGSQAKLYLTDPLLAWLPSLLRAGMAAPDMTRLTEATIGVSLARAVDDLEEGAGSAATRSGMHAPSQAARSISPRSVSPPSTASAPACRWNASGWTTAGAPKPRRSTASTATASWPPNPSSTPRQTCGPSPHPWSPCSCCDTLRSTCIVRSFVHFTAGVEVVEVADAHGRDRPTHLDRDDVRMVGGLRRGEAQVSRGPVAQDASGGCAPIPVSRGCPRLRRRPGPGVQSHTTPDHI